MDRFLKDVATNFEKRQVEKLKGKTLLCHCEPWQACHADILVDLVPLHAEEDIEEFKEEAVSYVFGNAPDDPVYLDCIDDGLPVRPRDSYPEKEKCGQEHTEDYPENEWVKRENYTEKDPRGGNESGARYPQPRVAHFMGKDRPYEDGGGRCSPGYWHRGIAADAGGAE